jgi:hypothetical protein
MSTAGLPSTTWARSSARTLAAKDYYQIVNTGSEPLVLFGNRSEAFGGAHILADGKDRSKLQQGA